MKKFFSISELDIGTFFGGPLLGFYILSQNYKQLGKDALAKKFLGWGFLVLMALILLSVFIPIIQKAGIIIIIILIFVLRGHYKKKQLPEINKISEESRSIVSGWKVFGLILLSALVSFSVAFVMGLGLVLSGIISV